jgi:hypothetical protein
MTSGFLPISIDAQSNLLEVDREFGDHESHDAHGGNHPPCWPRLRLNQFTLKLSSRMWESTRVFINLVIDNRSASLIYESM